MMVERSKNPTLQILKRELMRDKSACLSFLFLITLIIGVMVMSVVIHQSGAMQHNFSLDASNRPVWNLPPSLTYLLGTDPFGRSMLTLLVVATRNSLSIIALVTLLSSVLGIAYGLIAGYYGGTVDEIMLRVIEMISIFPNLILVMILMNAFNVSTPMTFAISMSLVTWMPVARMIRTRSVQEKELEYVQVSKTLGTSHLKIIFSQLLPNLSTVVVTSITLNIIGIIGMETGLSFLFHGIYSVDDPSLGTLVAMARSPIVLRHRHWQWLPPAVVITLIMLSINNVGNLLNRTSDARQRRG